MLELVDRNYLHYSDFCVPSGSTTEAGVPVGDTTLDRVEELSDTERRELTRRTTEALPPGTIAYRFGDFVFTYPGINLGNPDPKLWLFVQIPENASTSAFQVTMYEVAFANGTTTMGFSNDFQGLLKEQNKVRARSALPPLPDPRTVKHDKPAVAPGWRPTSQPTTDTTTPLLMLRLW